MWDSPQCGREDERLEARSSLRLNCREVFLLPLDSQPIRQRAQAHTRFVVLWVDQQRLHFVVGKEVDDVFLDTAGLPAEEQFVELLCNFLPTCRVLPLVVGKSAETQAARGERFKKAERGFMSATVGNMNPVLLQWCAHRLLKKSDDETEFGRALGNDREAREECLWVGFALPCHGRRCKLADSASMVDVPEACFGRGRNGRWAMGGHENLRFARLQALPSKAFAGRAQGRVRLHRQG